MPPDDRPVGGADFGLLEGGQVEALMGEGAPNVHMWILQDVLETAQFMIMTIKTGAVADRATLELMAGLLVQSAAVEVLEEAADWEGSRSFFSPSMRALSAASLRTFSRSTVLSVVSSGGMRSS